VHRSKKKDEAPAVAWGKERNVEKSPGEKKTSPEPDERTKSPMVEKGLWKALVTENGGYHAKKKQSTGGGQNADHPGGGSQSKRIKPKKRGKEVKRVLV